jgi:hypothetical protein
MKQESAAQLTPGGIMPMGGGICKQQAIHTAQQAVIVNDVAGKREHGACGCISCAAASLHCSGWPAGPLLKCIGTQKS